MDKLQSSFFNWCISDDDQKRIETKYESLKQSLIERDAIFHEVKENATFQMENISESLSPLVRMIKIHNKLAIDNYSDFKKANELRLSRQNELSNKKMIQNQIIRDNCLINQMEQSIINFIECLRTEVKRLKSINELEVNKRVIEIEKSIENSKVSIENLKTQNENSKSEFLKKDKMIRHEIDCLKFIIKESFIKDNKNGNKRRKKK